jgi:predicted metal-dependent peptidase
MFVLAHEIDHAAKKHCLRRGSRDPLAWNVACDYSNNLFLKDCGFKIWSEGPARRAVQGREQVRDVGRPHLQHPA